MADNYLNKTGLAYFWGKITNALSGKQDALVSGTNIKTVNGNSLLGSGNLSINGVDFEIESNTDLNNCTDTGNYYCASDAIASTLVHSPTGGAFRMYVISGDGSSSSIHQAIYRNTNDKIFKRRSLDGGTTWSDWLRSDCPFFTDLNNTSSATDLNDVREIGAFEVWSATGLVNSPESDYVRLFVYGDMDGSTITQIATPTFGNSFYARNYVGNTWNNWVRLDNAAVDGTLSGLETVVNSLSTNKQDKLTAGDWIDISSNTITSKAMRPLGSTITNFNSLTAPGFYSIGSANGLTNGPDTTKYYTVVVFATNDASTIRQVAWPTASNGNSIWTRMYRSSWGAWVKLIYENTPLFQTVRYSYTYSVAASGSTNVTKNQLGITVPSGYTISGYVGMSTGNANIVPRSWNPQSTATGTSIVLRNVSSTAVSNQTLTVDVLYLATSHVGS